MFLEGKEEGNAEQSCPDFEKQYSQTQFDQFNSILHICMLLKKKGKEKNNIMQIFSFLFFLAA